MVSLILQPMIYDLDFGTMIFFYYHDENVYFLIDVFDFVAVEAKAESLIEFALRVDCHVRCSRLQEYYGWD